MCEMTATTDIALSLAGRDRGKIFLVLGIDGGRAVLIDGKLRKLENPKCKALRHLKFMEPDALQTARKINEGTIVSNREIRRVLAVYKAGRPHDRGGKLLGKG